METEIKIFISYLHNTKRMSGNTVVSYERDLKKMMQYFQEAHQINPGTGYHGNQSEFLICCIWKRIILQRLRYREA